MKYRRCPHCRAQLHAFQAEAEACYYCNKKLDTTPATAALMTPPPSALAPVLEEPEPAPELNEDGPEDDG